MSDGDTFPIKANPAEAFKRMAASIEHNANGKFGGAVVIVPPDGGDGSIEFLMLDASGNVAQFWSDISTRIKITLDQLAANERQRQGFGR